MVDPQVVEETARHRFVTVVDGRESELEYSVDDKALTLLHTRVPEELGGQGVAGHLVQAAIDKAEHEGLSVAPSCPYTRRWLERHPEEAARVTIDWSASENQEQ